MDLFIEDFSKKCNELKIDVPRSFMDIISRKSVSQLDDINTQKELNLTGCSLNQNTCLALGNTFSENNFVTKLIIGDGFLGDDGYLFL